MTKQATTMLDTRSLQKIKQCKVSEVIGQKLVWGVKKYFSGEDIFEPRPDRCGTAGHAEDLGEQGTGDMQSSTYSTRFSQEAYLKSGTYLWSLVCSQLI